MPYNGKSIAEGGLKLFKIFCSCAAFGNAMLTVVGAAHHRLSSCTRKNNFVNGD
jgi:hypothetical protein